MLKPAKMLGSHDVLFITIDSLRYDVAFNALNGGMTPALADALPGRGWDMRETPGNFTYAAHQAFFAGFLPVPPDNPRQPRLFACKFTGSETIDEDTLVFDAPDIVSGFAKAGYHTVCIGGVGFFSKQNPLGSVLPSLFMESHWSTQTSVTSTNSTESQVLLARSVMNRLPVDKRIFMFINISATHQPTGIFAPGSPKVDTPQTQAYALAYADKHLGSLFKSMRKRAPTLTIICADHGTSFGENGYYGHRNNHPSVLTVPYAEFVLERI